MTETLTVNGIEVVVNDPKALTRLGADWLRILADGDQETETEEGDE